VRHSPRGAYTPFPCVYIQGSTPSSINSFAPIPFLLLSTQTTVHLWTNNIGSLINVCLCIFLEKMLERDQHVQFTLRYMISHTTSCQKRKTKNGYLKQVVQLQTNQSHAAHVSDPVNQVYSRLSNLSDNCTCYSQILPPNRVGPEDAINVLLHKKEISFR
jgi:hypothetical protein